MSNKTVNRKFTAIYNERYQVDDHAVCITHMQRIKQMDGESVEDMLRREAIEDSTVYLFCGHPRLQEHKK